MEQFKEDKPIKNTFESAPEEWKEFFRTFKAVREKVLNKIFDLEISEGDEYLKRIEDKENESFATVEKPGKYLAYHQSIGSGTGPVYTPLTDFKGEHSLLKYYQELLKELEEKEKDQSPKP